MQHFFSRYQLSETVILGGIALLLGLLSSIGIWIFKRLIDLFHLFAFDQVGGALTQTGPWLIILVPVMGGLIVAGIHLLLNEQGENHGVAGIMESVALAGGRLRYRLMPLRALGSALSIGFGASVGPEDPSVQIGANVGSLFGQKLRFSEERVRALVAAGAASGVAAAFNAPIAAVFFSLEVILGEIGGSALGVVVLSAVTSAVFTQAVSGPQPAFVIPAYALNSPAELLIYFLLGLIAGPISVGYIRLLYWTRDGFRRIRLPEWSKPAFAGAILGGFGYFLPQVFGVGYSTIESILGNQSLPIILLMLLLGAKMILTPISLAGGFMGGVFAPSLFIGAVLGAIVGQTTQAILPDMMVDVPAFAMVGMAAVLAGATHAPLTAILLLFEMTHDYRIILPLMFAVVISMIISRWLSAESVYTLGLARKGIRLERGRDVEVLETITVGEVMQTEPVSLRAGDTLQTAAEIFSKQHRHGLPVLSDEGELVGVFTLQDLEQQDPSSWRTRTVVDACTHELLVAYPDETIGAALRRMGRRDIGRLPVVERVNPRHLVGLLRRTDLVRAYDVALTRRAALRHYANRTRLDAATPEAVEVFEVTVEKGSECDGKRLIEISWPRECIVASLRRGRRTEIPHGDTLVQAGDVLLIVAEKNILEVARRLCQAQRNE